MHTRTEQSPPSDMCLLLRADAEHRWLRREVITVLEEMRARKLAEQDVGAALAYLEAMWDEAQIRARETDAAHSALRPEQGGSLSDQARRYHAAVQGMRRLLSDRLARAIASGVEPQESAGRCEPQAA